MVYDFYIRKIGNIFFSLFITADIANTMILMTKGKLGEERALGKFPVYKSISTILDGNI